MPHSQTNKAKPSQLRVGLLSVSDRAYAGTYVDQGIPALKDWLDSALITPWEADARLVPDDAAQISAALIDMVDNVGCQLVLTTGGTGPAMRDVTPEATAAVAHRVLPGFGEEMRRISLHFVPTAILSRQMAVTRGNSLIINLPGQPRSIKETLEGVRDATGKITLPGIFAAVPYCLELMDGPIVKTRAEVVVAFRPKSAPPID